MSYATNPNWKPAEYTSFQLKGIRMNDTKAPFYVVRYAGDVATGTPDTWQIWTKDELDNEARTNGRVLEVYKANTPAVVQRLAEALELALVQWPAAHRDQPRIIGQIKSALAAWEDAQ